jgi:arabinogalactan endo-1,4-beta-galactosidase
MLSLLQSANKAVRDVNPGTKIITHYAGYEGAENFYTLVQELDYDIIGLSFYLLWRGKSLSELDNALKRLQQKFEKDILIAETAYPFTLGWNDQTNNIVRLDDQLILPYF